MVKRVYKLTRERFHELENELHYSKTVRGGRLLSKQGGPFLVICQKTVNTMRRKMSRASSIPELLKLKMYLRMQLL